MEKCSSQTSPQKLGLELVFPSFRPVRNLPFISKLTEKASVNQLSDHMNKVRPLSSGQSAYRPFHSTETALLKVQSDILLNMDDQKVTLLVMLDLSAAFDTIDQGILLNIPFIHVREDQITPVTSVRNLGVIFYSNLKTDMQITKACQSAYFIIPNIRRI